jgi:transposase
MIQIAPQLRILVAVEAVDFRNGIDGLARVYKEQMKMDPFSGCMFVFRSRRGTAIKILVYDGRGFWLCQKIYKHFYPGVHEEIGGGREEMGEDLRHAAHCRAARR